MKPMRDYSQMAITLHTSLMRFEDVVKQANGRNPELVREISDAFASQVVALEKLTTSVQSQLSTACEALTSPDHNDYEGNISE
jgi:hypothetical protein